MAFKLSSPVKQTYAQDRFHRLSCLVGVHLHRAILALLFVPSSSPLPHPVPCLEGPCTCLAPFPGTIEDVLGKGGTTTLENRRGENTTPGFFLFSTIG